MPFLKYALAVLVVTVGYAFAQDTFMGVNWDNVTSVKVIHESQDTWTANLVTTSGPSVLTSHSDFTEDIRNHLGIGDHWVWFDVNIYGDPRQRLGLLNLNYATSSSYSSHPQGPNGPLDGPAWLVKGPWGTYFVDHPAMMKRVEAFFKDRPD